MELETIKLNRSEWVLTRLGDLAKDISKRVDNPSESNYERFVGLEHFVSGDLKIKKWGSTENLTSSTKAFKKGDVLLARRNAYLRRASLVEFDGVCSGDAFVLRENHDKVVPGFIAFVVNSTGLWDYANANAAGTMSKRVKWRDLENYEFLLPPKHQQVGLSELLWSIDTVIEKELKVLEKNQRLIDSFRMDVFSRTKWPMRRLNDFFEVQLGKMLSKKAKTGSSPYVYLANQNVQWGKIDTKTLNIMDFNEKEREKFSLQYGDLLVCEGGEVGRAAIWRNDVEDCFYQKALHRLRVIEDSYSPEVMLQFMIWANAQGLFKGLTGHSTIAHLTAVKLKEMKIPEIPFDEREQVKHKFSILIANLNQIEGKLLSSKSLQKSLINQVF